MANLLNATRFQNPNPAVNPVTVTIPATSAGSKLVVVSGGGATIQAKLGGPGGTNFTKQIVSLNNREVSAQDIVDAGGGTTTITLSLNGAENVDGMVYEFAAGSLGNFVAGDKDGGVGGNSTFDHTSGNAYTGRITTSGPTVLFMMFTTGDTPSPVPARQMWGMAPLGKQYFNGFNDSDPAKSLYWSLIGLSDQPAAGTFQGQTSSISPDSEHQSIIAAYTDNQPGTPTYASPYANYIAAENSLPGALSPAWHGANTNANISGYTDSMAYAPGDTVNFMVDSANNAFTLDITRFGYYGYVLFGGKPFAVMPGTPAAQPAPAVDAYGGTVCSWSVTASWAIPADATPGIYVYNMRRNDNAAYLAQGIFVIKNTTPVTTDPARMMLITADFTWQAHNPWGATTDTGNSYAGFTGRNLYGQAPVLNTSGRAYAVSADRPMGSVSASPETYFWDSEAALVNFLEGNGYPVDYYTMADIEKDPTIPSKYGVAVASGHNAYWTPTMRDAFENARDSGTNLMFFSSGTSLWRARFDPADTAKRRLICYKDSYDLAGWDGSTKYDPVSYTGTWRDVRTNAGGVNNTARRPESGMAGLWFAGNGDFEYTLAVANSYRTLPVWRDTRFANNVSISYGASSSASLSTAGGSVTVSQPVGTIAGDLMVAVITFNGSPGDITTNGGRVIRTIDDGTHTTVVMSFYALQDGTGTVGWSWANPRMATAVLVNYKNAIMNDSDSSILMDTAGASAHTTDPIIPASNDRWAVCVFTDAANSGSSKTTSWTPGGGLTSRIQADNSGTGGPWHSLAVLDTNGAVTQAAHQYTATAQFANGHAAACIFYITPGQPVNNARTIGNEWDYLKIEEPSTPKNTVRLSDQIIPISGQAATYNGATYSNSGVLRYGLNLYKASSGALVFSTGAWRFPYGLSHFRRNLADGNGAIDVTMQQATLNLIRDMGISPTTILSTTSNNDPTPLVDPSPAHTAAEYGLTVTDPGYKTIFGTAVPAVTDATNAGGDNVLGTVFTANANGRVYGIRWYFPETLPNRQVIALLYSWTNDTTGTELARATAINIQTGWNEVLFSSPVTIAQNTKYVAAVWTYDRKVFNDNIFTSAGVTNGPLAAPQDNSVTHNGKILSGNGSPAFPSGDSGLGTNYMADVLFLGNGVVTFEGWGFPIN